MDLLEMVLSLGGEEKRVGECLVFEATMNALALINELDRLGVETLIVLGPLHRKGRKPGVYVSRIEPSRGPENPILLVKELWGNLTGSLRLEDYAAALRILYGKAFYVAECEPGEGEGGCKSVVEQWLREQCGGQA